MPTNLTDLMADKQTKKTFHLNAVIDGRLISGFVAVVEEFAGGIDPCVVPVLGAWPKRKGISVASIKRTKTQETASDRLMLSPRDIEISCQRAALLVFAAASPSTCGPPH